jgi:hypothetical protein
MFVTHGLFTLKDSTCSKLKIFESKKVMLGWVHSSDEVNKKCYRILVRKLHEKRKLGRPRILIWMEGDGCEDWRSLDYFRIVSNA